MGKARVSDKNESAITGVIEIQLKLPLTVQKRKKWFVAGCPQLDVFTQGETEKEAEGNLREALRLFLHSCLERNTLTQVFGTMQIVNGCGFD